MKEVIEHYNRLIEENNDPVRDPQPLKEYMDKWDGERFVECMRLDKNKSVLEIGIGTGRIAVKTAPLCRDFLGIDISPKTIQRAADNLSFCQNVELVCDDFMSFEFDRRFDVIYSSLTFMHIENKCQAIQKIASLLNDGGMYVLSIDKNKSEYIDMGTRKVKIYPDDPLDICDYIHRAKLDITDQFETEYAYIIASKKSSF